MLQTWGPVIGSGAWPGWLVWKALADGRNTKTERKMSSDEKMTKAVFDKDATLALQAATMFDRMEKELERLTARVGKLQESLWAAEASIGEYKAHMSEAKAIICTLRARLGEADGKPALTGY